MTGDESKQLKIGEHVCFDGEQADRGKVIAIQARYVTIKWEDGHKSFTGHNDMTRIERAVARKSGQ
jgi:hypothetical protein